ncbi:MAG: hypothetical protein WCO68_06220 [Verrucomicrobiota bacterium]
MPNSDLHLLPESAVNTFLSPYLRRTARPSLSTRLLPALALAAALFFSMIARGADCNALVLAQVQAMPRGGTYAANRLAMERFTSAVGVRNGALSVQAATAAPNFCSEATYLVFLKTIAAQQALDPATIDALLIHGQPDGQGAWGRWNANGPGTARLFHELGLGRNFDDFEQARPGDFMKIFWSTEVGSRERGHSVVFLGREERNGVETVRFWSSNTPAGYGEKAVPRSRIAYAIFSRLEHPEALNRLPTLPTTDAYLARLNALRSSVAEARAKTGI